MNNLDKLLILKALPKVGNSKINNEYKSILTKDYSLEEFYDVLSHKGFSIFDINTAATIMQDTLKQLEDHPEYKAITIFEDSYPSALHDLGNAKPVIIYACGDIGLFSKPSLGIIGTRNPDRHVLEYSPRIISHSIDTTSPVIVSGLANGCDTIGHNTALEKKAPTIAVLPCGFNKIRPKAKKALAEKIVSENGLLISEYTPNVEETRFTPVQRDAIIAALSQRVITLQCGEKSGTMHTLDTAFSISRPIGCYMPSVIEGDFAGHKYAISKYKAQPIKSFEDLDAFLESTISKAQENEQLSLF